MEGWKESISFYEQEIERSFSLLKTVIQLNTIPDLAAKVDHFYRGYENHLQSMKTFEHKLNEIEDTLMSGEEPKENLLIGDMETSRQKDSRNEMQRMESAYLEYKYQVDEFIAETLIVQNRHA
jgi:hypothetical protein